MNTVIDADSSVREPYQGQGQPVLLDVSVNTVCTGELVISIIYIYIHVYIARTFGDLELNCQLKAHQYFIL